MSTELKKQIVGFIVAFTAVVLAIFLCIKLNLVSGNNCSVSKNGKFHIQHIDYFGTYLLDTQNGELWKLEKHSYLVDEPWVLTHIDRLD